MYEEIEGKKERKKESFLRGGFWRVTKEEIKGRTVSAKCF